MHVPQGSTEQAKWRGKVTLESLELILLNVGEAVRLRGGSCGGIGGRRGKGEYPRDPKGAPCRGGSGEYPREDVRPILSEFVPCKRWLCESHGFREAELVITF